MCGMARLAYACMMYTSGRAKNACLCVHVLVIRDQVVQHISFFPTISIYNLHVHEHEHKGRVGCENGEMK